MKGIKSLLDWQWYTDTNTKVLFIHLLLKAFDKDSDFRGMNLKRGELITSRKELSNETGLTEQQVRTSLNKLKSTNEITNKSTNLNSLISIVSYDIYFPNNQQNNQRATNKIMDVLEVKIKEFEKIKQLFLSQVLWQEQLAMKNKLTSIEIKEMLDLFFSELEDKMEYDRTEAEIRSYFVNWLKVTLKKKINEKDKSINKQREKSNIPSGDYTTPFSS